MEVVPLKNLFFLAVLELDLKKILLDTTKKLKGWEKPSLQYKRIIYKHWLACIILHYLILPLSSMYFRVNLKNEKAKRYVVVLLG